MMAMLDAPKQNWKRYVELCEAEHTRWLRSLTVQQSWELYRSLFDFAAQVSASQFPDAVAVQRRWEEKLANRQRLVAAFAKLDEWRRDKRSDKNAV